MNVLGYSIEDWIALLSFLGGIIFGLLKFYGLFTKMDQTLGQLNQTVKSIEERFDSHETRITRLEEQNKHIIKNIQGGNTNED